jgi:carboxypeptidase Q
VPTLNFTLTDVKGYDFDYMEIWHTERDLFNKSIPEYQEHAALVTAITVLGVANLDHLLKRTGYFNPPVETNPSAAPQKKGRKSSASRQP